LGRGTEGSTNSFTAAISNSSWWIILMLISLGKSYWTAAIASHE